MSGSSRTLSSLSCRPAASAARTSSLMPSTVSTAVLFAVAAAGMRWSNSTSASASPMPPLLMLFVSASALHHHIRRRMLGEDVDWLHELSIDMFSEDGCLRVYGVGEDGVPAFTEYGIECLKQIIADKRAAGGAPPPIRSTK